MRATAVLITGLLVLGALVQCGLPDPSSRSGGLSLEVAVEDTGQVALLYRFEQDGMLSFGGGATARAKEIAWTGRMSDDDIATLRSLLDEHGWFDGGPPSESGKRVSRIRMRWPDGRVKTTVHGRGRDLMAVESYLESIARRRLEPMLDALPKPTQEVVADPQGL